MPDVLIRPMLAADVPVEEQISDEAFYALNQRTSLRAGLLWACLADAGQEYLVPHVTAANQWAIDVALTAGLDLAQQGYLGARGMAPPRRTFTTVPCCSAILIQGSATNRRPNGCGIGFDHEHRRPPAAAARPRHRPALGAGCRVPG